MGRGLRLTLRPISERCLCAAAQGGAAHQALVASSVLAEAVQHDATGTDEDHHPECTHRVLSRAPPQMVSRQRRGADLIHSVAAP